MRKQSYYELLRHPLWQKKRLEIMQRAEFTCEQCGRNDVTLNVHHNYYEKNLSPWDYPDDSLRCLCEHCHNDITQLTKLVHQAFGQLHPFDMERVYGYIMAMNEERDKLWDSPWVHEGFDHFACQRKWQP